MTRNKGSFDIYFILFLIALLIFSVGGLVGDYFHTEKGVVLNQITANAICSYLSQNLSTNFTAKAVEGNLVCELPKIYESQYVTFTRGGEK